MIEVGAYLVVVVLVFGLGIRLGMIVAGRIDRRLTPPEATPPSAPHEEQL